MTNAPSDLLTVRVRLMAITGLADPADVGIVGDGIHAHTGGYHEGRDVLAAIGALNSDYSVVEYARDQAGLTDSASALDVSLAWPNGGRAAAIRWTNLLVADLLAAAPGTECLRAMNYSPDGTAKRRRDKRYGLVEQTSSDSVDIHTHFELFRDTEGQRAGAFSNLLLRRARQAITGTDPTPTPSAPTGDDMPQDSGELAPGFAFDENGNWLDETKALIVPVPQVGPKSSGEWGPAWLYVAAPEDAVVRHATLISGAYHDWADAHPGLFAAAGPIGLGDGTTAVLLGRKKASATDTADSVPVRWRVQYG